MVATDGAMRAHQQAKKKHNGRRYRYNNARAMRVAKNIFARRAR